MIESIQLKFGRTPGLPSETIKLTPVTVFVGPNNSGKSRILREIHQYCCGGRTNGTDVILDKMAFKSMTPPDADNAISHVRQTLQPGEAINVDCVIVGKRGVRRQIGEKELRGFLQDPNLSHHSFCDYWLSYNTLMLDGRSRINLVSQQEAGDLQRVPITSFQVLFRDDARRKEVRRIVHEAFGNYFVLDPTQLGQFKIRLSEREPTSDMEERGIHDEAVCFHAAAQLIDHGSDGVKAFTGIITELIAGDPRVVLIDEPEAFLHPSLAFKLGNEIAKASNSSGKSVFVSTHSPTFVMGCIQSGTHVNIIRLTYRSGVPTARLLPSTDILPLMRNPLLRSTGVLSGLFYEFVVVTEADSDRAFYQEINERLLRFKPEWGIPNCLFLNAQNKQTVHTIIQPLRALGIPAAGIVDVDVIKEGGDVWTRLLASAHVPQLSHQPLGSARAAILNAVTKMAKKFKENGGVDVLSGQDRDAANDLFDQLGDYGLFVVRKGELEAWLSDLKAPGHGPNWLIDIFEKMGDDPENGSYLRPTLGDVWEFVSQIRDWLTTPTRKGIPV